MLLKSFKYSVGGEAVNRKFKKRKRRSRRRREELLGGSERRSVREEGIGEKETSISTKLGDEKCLV